MSRNELSALIGHHTALRAAFLARSPEVHIAAVFFGLNLPISEQAVGARATRTTHPQVLGGFADLFSLLVEERFAVENPFLWLTKTEVVNLIGDAGCSHLIQQSVSCMHTHEQTTEQPHCGRCAQCISRRYATLASRFGDSDLGSLYKVDLLTGERLKDKDLTLVESFIRTATEIKSMGELQVVEHYGEVSRVLRHVRPLSSNQVAERVVQLYRRHSSEVAGVMDGALRAHASDIREGKLPSTCAILLAIPESYKKVTVAERRESSRAPVASSTAGTMLRGQEAQVAKESRRAKKPVRRNEKYEGIDKALREFAAARPKSHEDVFRLLDDRKVGIPSRRPFKSAGGWLKGFQQSRHSASAWLSQAWGRLSLPAFPRGPRK